MTYERIPYPTTPGYFDLDVNDLHPPEPEEGTSCADLCRVTDNIALT